MGGPSSLRDKIQQKRMCLQIPAQSHFFYLSMANY